MSAEENKNKPQQHVGEMRDRLQIMTVTILTFLEVRWVGRDGGLNSPITVKGSDLWTKPVSSLYLGEKNKSNMLR